MRASRYGYLEVARVLLEAGANINAVADTGITAQGLAGTQAMLDFLREYGT